MRTAGPAARSALSFGEFCPDPLNVVRAGALLLDRYRPADPLIPRQRGETVPRVQDRLIGGECLPKIVRHVVNDAGRHVRDL